MIGWQRRKIKRSTQGRHPCEGSHLPAGFCPVVSAALKELSSQHPDLHCTLVLGEEQELTGALACGSVDLALVSDHTAMSSVQYPRPSHLAASVC